jgi:hypothetical protein
MISSLGLNEQCQIVCGNALEQDYSQGTVFYLYLVPRGLRLILPILKAIPHPIRVITYMAPFPESEIPITQIKCTPANQPEAMWPLYLYHFDPGSHLLNDDHGSSSQS